MTITTVRIQNSSITGIPCVVLFQSHSPTQPPTTNPQQPLICSPFLYKMLYKWIHTICDFWDQLFSLSISPSRSIVVVLSIVSSFWLSCVPWYGYISVCFTIYALKDIWIIPSLGLLQVKWLWTLMYRFLWEHSFHFPEINDQECNFWIMLNTCSVL